MSAGGRAHLRPGVLRVRPAAVAGSFYPADPAALTGALRRAFGDAAPAGAGGPDVAGGGEAAAPKVLVVPHAGYPYSGPVAASAYLRLAPTAGRIRRVVLIGPSHRVRFEGMAVTGADAFETPLGLVPVDAAAREAVLRVGPFVHVHDRPHAAEHSLEVQLPFLQVVLERFELLPLAVGHCPAEEVAAALDAVWGGPETLILVSTDLSHYHRYAEARTLDARTAAAVADLAPERIGDRDACGAYPLRGALLAARARGLAPAVLDLRSSGDTAGDHEAVVGYGAFAFA